MGVSEAVFQEAAAPPVAGNLRRGCMKKIWMVLLIIAGVVIVFGGMVIAGLNKPVILDEQVNNTWAQVENQLQRRVDLIPNLVNTVKGYMEHERGTLTEITELRAKATSGQLSDDDKVDLDNKISKALGGIMIAVENYPDLKANQNFLQLQGSLNEIEEQISAAARRAYNASVTDYNNAVEMFPTNIMASVMSYKLKKVFEIVEAERKNVNVKDLFSNK